MPRYRVSEVATADLDAIWLYVVVQGSLDAADRLIDAITERFPWLATHPGMGTARDEFAPGLRSLVAPHLTVVQAGCEKNRGPAILLLA